MNGIHAYRSAEKTGEWLTMTEAAIKLGLTNHQIRRLIKDRALAGEQVVPGARYQIRACDLDDQRLIAALGRNGRPCRVAPETSFQCFQRFEEGGHNERLIAMPRIAFSAILLSASRRASVAKRDSATRRLMM